MNSIIEKINSINIKNIIPSFRPSDLVEVKIWIYEGNKRRLQLFKGIVIAIKNKGINSNFTVRKISNNYGESVERTFQTYSPAIYSIVVKRYGKVKQAKLYYLRKLSGKSARIKEKLNS